MILYINAVLGTVLLAYYDAKMKLRVDYFGYHSDAWLETDVWYNSMDKLRQEIIKAGVCDILHDDGEL